MGVEDEANLVIVEYVLREKDIQAKRAKTCGCGSCKGELENAQDRENWDLNLGRWREHRKVGNLTKGQKRYDIYDSGDMVEA